MDELPEPVPERLYDLADLVIDLEELGRVKPALVAAVGRLVRNALEEAGR